jgi:molybdopterin/thiamine biosynthesis adenylyltransferase
MSSEKQTESENGPVDRIFPEGTSACMNLKAVDAASMRMSTSGLVAEIKALEKRIIPERYVRNMKTFSPEDQIRLLKSSVIVAGLGGLGGAVVEILARAGIGTLKMIDGDHFEDSNLNRQILSNNGNIGIPKVRAAGERVGRVNPSVIVEIHEKFLDQANASELIRGADVVVDCLDNLKTRFILETASKAAGIPLVSAAAAGITGHVTSVFPDDPGLKQIYGEFDESPVRGAEAILGCLPHTVLLLAALECSEVFKIILKKENLLRNRLLVVDLNDYMVEVLRLDGE